WLGTEASGTSRCHVDDALSPAFVALPRLEGSSATKIGAFGEKSGYRFLRAASSASNALMIASDMKPNTSAQFGSSADGVTTTTRSTDATVIQLPSGFRTRPTLRSSEVRTATV